MRKSRFEKLREKFPTLDRDKLYQEYIINEKSLPILYKEYGLDFRAGVDLLKYFNIPMRNISQSRLTVNGKRRIQNSFINKYGVKNPSQIDWVKKKKKETFIKHYGVDNIWKSPEYYKWLNDYMLLNYGVLRLCTNPWGWLGAGQKRKTERLNKMWSGRDKWWESLTDEEKSTLMSNLCGKNTSTSKIENRICESLNRLHISHKRWFSIGRRNFDFKIDGCQIVFEVNGDFWHANPKIYKSDELIHFPDHYKLAKNVWKNDEQKRLIAEKNGYKVITIWESELKLMSDKDIDCWVIKNIL